MTTATTLKWKCEFVKAPGTSGAVVIQSVVTREMTMPNYRNRRIELIPKRQRDWTWQCPYVIIEFRPTCWAYHNGCPEERFASRQEAVTAAFEKAKVIIDSLELFSPTALSGLGLVLGTYWHRMKRLLVSFVRSVVCSVTIALRGEFGLRYITNNRNH